MKKTKGFTLIELVVVMAIIAFLMLILIGGIIVARTASRTAANRTNGNSIRLALEAYYAKNQTYPVIPTGKTAIDASQAATAVTGVAASTNASYLKGFGIDDGTNTTLKLDGCSDSGAYVLSIASGYAIWIANAPVTGTTCTPPTAGTAANITGP